MRGLGELVKIIGDTGLAQHRQDMRELLFVLDRPTLSRASASFASAFAVENLALDVGAKWLVSGQFFKPGALFKSKSEGEWWCLFRHLETRQTARSGSFAGF